MRRIRSLRIVFSETSSASAAASSRMGFGELSSSFHNLAILFSVWLFISVPPLTHALSQEIAFKNRHDLSVWRDRNCPGSRSCRCRKSRPVSWSHRFPAKKRPWTFFHDPLCVFVCSWNYPVTACLSVWQLSDQLRQLHQLAAVCTIRSILAKPQRMHPCISGTPHIR